MRAEISNKALERLGSAARPRPLNASVRQSRGKLDMIENLGLACDLESLQAGALDAALFRRKYDEGVGSPALEAVWPNLAHYLDDADIRAKDAAYHDMQDGEFARLIQLLRQQAPIEVLRRITFLRST
jgi:hypothetical protein